MFLDAHAARALVAALASLCACSSRPPPEVLDEPWARSGSRLKLRWYAFDGGARVWADAFLERYFDSELGETCAPAEWADGKTYCTPWPQASRKWPRSAASSTSETSASATKARSAPAGTRTCM